MLVRVMEAAETETLDDRRAAVQQSDAPKERSGLPLWKTRTISRFREIPLMSKRLRIVYKATPSYLIDWLANRPSLTERESLAHGPSERPRKARFAFWTTVEDEQNIEISGDTTHV